MNTKKTQLNRAKLEGFSKAELITEWEILQLENEELKETIEQMRALLRLGSSQKFGASSERLKQEQAGQMSLLNDEPFGVFNEAEAIIEEEAQELEEPKKGHARRIKGEVGGSKRCFDHLPVVEVIEELPEEEQSCPSCHGQMKQMTSSERIEIEVIPAQIIKKKFITHSYVCNQCSQEGVLNPIVQAPKRLPVIPGSYVSASLMAYIMAKKYWERTTIYQLETMLLNTGIKISRATLSRWIITGAELYLRGVYDLLHQELVDSDILHADETKVQVLKEKGRRPQQTSYMWHYPSGHLESKQIRLYEYQPGRAAEYPLTFLEGFSGYLHSDGYQAYHQIPGVTNVGCHAHARRMFVDTIKSLGPSAKNLHSKTLEGFMFFEELSELERKFKNMTPEERYEARLKQSKPKLEALKAWLVKTQGEVTPRSALGRAIAYSLNQWKYLMAYLEDGRLEMTNNRALSTSLGNPHLSSEMRCGNAA